MTDDEHINRIDAITRNARNTWFALLGVLVFVGITLTGVEHIDFYGVNRATKLPLVNVEVPTRSFFFAAPVLTAAIFGYFHLYLIRLWDALGSAPATVAGHRLGDAISPWLVSDAALYLRNRLRGGDPCAIRRALDWPAMLLNFLLAWLLGIAILGWLWWASMPARSVGITGVAGVSLLLACFCAASSCAMLFLRMGRNPNRDVFPIWETLPSMAALVVLIPALALISYTRTNGSPNALAWLNLYSEPLVEKQSGWLPYDVAEREFRAMRCIRSNLGPDCKDIRPMAELELTEEWQIRRAALRADLEKPRWQKKARKPDLRNAYMWGTFLTGADLTGAELDRANLYKARAEGVVLNRTSMKGVNLYKTNMEEAKLSQANLLGADLYKTILTRAVLHSARLEKVGIYKAELWGADLSYSILLGTKKDPLILRATDMRSLINNGGAMRHVDLRGVNFDDKTLFRNVFLDETVLIPAELQHTFIDRCRISGAGLTDAEFVGFWRTWVESLGSEWTGDKGISPPGLETVPANEVSFPGCTWLAPPALAQYPLPPSKTRSK